MSAPENGKPTTENEQQMNYIKQIWYEMRHQKMMTWVAISGTALSIFLVMAFFMTEEAKTVAMSPESNRPRIYIGENFHMREAGKYNDSSSPVSYEFAQKFYSDLDGVERISFINAWQDNCDVNVKGGEMVSALNAPVDDEFWNIYDFTFIDGRPFENAEYKSTAKKAILTQGLARKLFGEDKVAGREVVIDCMPYDVVGVVEDVNPLFQTAYANIYTIYDNGKKLQNDPGFGNARAILLAKEGVTQTDLQRQVESRYAIVNSEFSKEGKEVVYHGQPYSTAEVMNGGYGSNNSPDLETSNRINYVIYAILILLPAINLSSMTRSRLRHRVTEIGVRRAFGAKKRSIIMQMFGENLIITLLGGAIGLIFSVLFVWLASSLFFAMTGDLDPSSLDVVNAQPTLAMLFTWKNFFVALGFCFILNIISATVPAWKASRVEPAVAIAKSR